MKLSHFPLRVTTGAYILNSGLQHRGLEGESAAAMHGMAAGALPQVRRIEPQCFARLLSRAEVTLGSALLFPAVPSALAGIGLAGSGPV